MATLSKNFKIWFHGLIAAAISAFSTAASGFVSIPSVFNFSHTGLINIVKLSTVPALISVFAYLRQSPVPALDSVTIDQHEIRPSGAETSTSVTIVSSPDNGQVK